MDLGQLATRPPQKDQGSAEDLIWACDVAEALDGGQTISAPVVVLVGRAPIDLPDGPTVLGTTIRQRVRAGTLQPGTRHRLEFRFTPSGTTSVVTSVLLLRCPL